MKQFVFNTLPNTSLALDSEIYTFKLNNLDNFSVELKELVSTFCKDYSSVNIPTQNLSLLSKLMEYYKLPYTKDDLILIGCALQYQYYMQLRIQEEEKDDVLTREFFEDKKQYENLLNILGLYLMKDSNKDLHSILFKYNRTDTTKIDNFFVLTDIYDAICKGYGLTRENFEVRKSEILSQTSQTSFSKRFTTLNKNWIKLLNTELTKLITDSSSSLRCLGVFLHIFHVPTNNKQPIELYDEFSDIVSSIDIKNLRHSLTR
ncbi:hypothetical protein HX057_15550 [Myroides odoratimimus]|uniref:hypothetical protein n=1 Tax=Myroides odoratimimus TaxID=76832 RepID=UPI002578505E|nr:hypothetical protein [Myroides odoratimimus]MDM1448157.1 hypothetical protein [Myroides odoratimimus]